MNVPARSITLAEPEGGWFLPWPNVIELSHVLPTERWVLVGGLMVQAHAMATVLIPSDLRKIWMSCCMLRSHHR